MTGALQHNWNYHHFHMFRGPTGNVSGLKSHSPILFFSFFFFFFFWNGNELAINHNRNVIQCSLQSRAETANYNMSEWRKEATNGDNAWIHRYCTGCNSLNLIRLFNLMPLKFDTSSNCKKTIDNYLKTQIISKCLHDSYSFKNKECISRVFKGCLANFSIKI